MVVNYIAARFNAISEERRELGSVLGLPGGHVRTIEGTDSCFEYQYLQS